MSVSELYEQTLKKYKYFLKGYVVPLIEVEDWIKTYNINRIDYNCITCDTHISPKLPFATKELRGYLTNSCLCSKVSKVMYVNVRK